MVKSPARVEVTPPSSISDNIEQKVLFVEHANKGELLAGLLQDKSVRRALVFARTKSQADRIARNLSRTGITVDVIHSNKTQSARQKALAAFDHGKVRVLVGTDIVARESMWTVSPMSSITRSGTIPKNYVTVSEDRPMGAGRYRFCHSAPRTRSLCFAG